MGEVLDPLSQLEHAVWFGVIPSIPYLFCASLQSFPGWAPRGSTNTESACHDATLMEPWIPLIFCIDVEPDEHVYTPEEPSPWTGFEALAAGAAGLRTRLSELTGAPARFVEGFASSLAEHPQAGRLVFTTPEDALLRLGLLPERTDEPSMTSSVDS